MDCFWWWSGCPFAFGGCGNQDNNATKDNVANYLQGILNNQQFVRQAQGNLGMHSL